jgi:uncharacterized protein (DUF1778 family)
MATAAAARQRDAQRRGVTINLRVSVYQKDLIDRAATLLGLNRSEFILETTRRRAEDVILDQKLFALNEDQYRNFLNTLDNPPEPNVELKKLFLTKAPWGE